MFGLRIIALVGLHWIASLASGPNQIITLDGYGSFTGTAINETFSKKPLPEPVDAWLGMDYSTQPVGDWRFRPVGWPDPFSGIQKADEYGKRCIQAGSGSALEDQAEACLNFNVFRTRGVPMSRKLSVLVWIYGGSFYSGSWESFDGASFAASSPEPMVVVTFHYRVNSLGSLPSKLFEEEGLLNLGLRDQHFFLQFVQKHIASFGGDPDAVTIGGRSAGGHSVGIHYFHNYGEDTGRPLFARAYHQSGSVTARTFPNATYPLYEKQMDEYMTALECPQDDNSAAMECLRNADINDIRNISTMIFNKYNPAITWPFQPVQGGPLLEKFGSQSGYDETFFHVPTISSTTTDEGKLFLPGDLETNDEFLGFLHNSAPDLNSTDLDLLEALYPDPATDPGSPYANSPNSTQYNRLAAAWSDFAYICPGQETAYRVSSAGVPTWKLRFDTPDRTPPWQGIPHTADLKYTWNEPDVEYPDISPVYHGYLASFVLSGDPNTYRYPGTPRWPAYEVRDGGAAAQLVVQPDGPKVERDTIRTEQCLYWRDPGRAPRLNK